jgi:hypothetical protein
LLKSSDALREAPSLLRSASFEPSLYGANVEARAFLRRPSGFDRQAFTHPKLNPARRPPEHRG